MAEEVFGYRIFHMAFESSIPIEDKNAFPGVLYTPGKAFRFA
jgi:hypothetical protein